MPASQEQKVDFLLKKIGYSASKTGIAEDESTISNSNNTAKAPFEEAIPSPLIIPSASLWSDSSSIPTTPPGSDTSYVKGYRTATALRMTRDATVGTNTRSYIAYTTYNNTSSARLTNWINSQFSADYTVRVFKGDPNSGGVELSQAGGNAGTDGWFFDYSSGILNFNGTNLPSGITATNIYIVGYRYIGATGVQPPAGIATFHDLYVVGLSTFNGNVVTNNDVTIGGNLTVNGTQTVLNTASLEVEDVNIGIASAASKLNNSQIDGAGITIYSSDGDKTITWDNSNSWVGINTLFYATRYIGAAVSNIIPFYYDNVSQFPSSSTYHGAVAHAHNTGRLYFAHAGWNQLVNVESNGIVGTGTQPYNVGIITATKADINGDIDVDGHTELDNLNVSGISTFQDDIFVGTGATVGIGSTVFFGDDVKLKFGGTDGLEIYHSQNLEGVNDSYIDSSARNLFIRLNTETDNGGNIALQAKKDEHGVLIEDDGPVRLHFDGNEKLTTTEEGVLVSGGTTTTTLNVTGISTFGGAISVGSTIGVSGQYLRSTGSGLAWASFPSTRSTDTQTATAGQTSFSFTYTVGYLDVFVNGVKLPPSEFTASNGSTVVLDDAAFANDTIEFVSYYNAPGAIGGAQNLNGLADVTTTAPVIGDTLQHNGSIFVNDYTVSTTTTSTSQTAIISLAVATYRSVEYTVQITEGTKYHVTKILAIHDGTNVTFNEYGTLITSTSLSTFTFDINSGNMRLLATPASTNSTVFKVKFTGIKV